MRFHAVLYCNDMIQLELNLLTVWVKTGFSGLDFVLVLLQSGLVWFYKRNGLLWFGTLTSGCSLDVRSTYRSSHTILHRVAASHTESSLKISVNFDKIL